jgi:hypothetical protein
MEFASNDAWTFLNVSSLYWHVFRRWYHLRRKSGMEAVDEPLEETVFLEEGGERALWYRHTRTAASFWRSCRYTTTCR